jgi:hypothetical protein
MGHQISVPNLPQTNSAHTPPGLPFATRTNLPFGDTAKFDAAAFDTGAFDTGNANALNESVPASPPAAAREGKERAQIKPRRSPRGQNAAPKSETIIKIRSRSQVIQYSRILIAALEEVVDYGPARRHNQPPPDLRIDDEGYLTEIRNLIAELRTLSSLLETTRRQPKKASDAVVKLTRHFDTFLNSYAKSLGKGAGWLTIGVIASLLYQAGVGQDVIGNILGHAKLPH